MSKKSRASKFYEIHRNDINIAGSENNRITYIFKTIKTGKIIEITSVTLDIKINNKWVTIVHYDSYNDGRLHRHLRLVIEDDTDITDYQGVRKKGTQRRLLTWAINDIKSKYTYYKKRFIFWNKEYLRKNNIEIEIY